MKYKIGVFFFVPLLISMVTAGCAARSAKASGFADARKLQAVDHEIPFKKGWAKINFEEHQRYKNIYIAPVNIDYLFEKGWWKNLERGHKVKEDARNLALYAHEALVEAFKNDPSHRFNVVDQPAPDTVILEFGIVELVPNKIFLKVASLAPYGGGLVRLLSMTNRSTVAFEARFRDAETWEVIMLLADREAEKAHILNFKDYVWYAHARSIIREWSMQMVVMCNKGPHDMIKDSRKFELKPW